MGREAYRVEYRLITGKKGAIEVDAVSHAQAKRKAKLIVMDRERLEPTILSTQTVKGYRNGV
jgi:hypothetical protein